MCFIEGLWVRIQKNVINGYYETLCACVWLGVGVADFPVFRFLGFSEFRIFGFSDFRIFESF